MKSDLLAPRLCRTADGACMTLLQPSAALAGHVLYYAVREGGVDDGRERIGRFPANLYGWIVLTHRGAVRDDPTGEPFPPIVVSGLQTRPTRQRYSGAPLSTIVVFRPGRIQEFVPLPPQEMNDRMLDGSPWFSAEQRRLLTTGLALVPDLRRRVALLEEVLLERLGHSRGVDPLAAHVDGAIARYALTPLDQWVDRLGVTHRTLQRHFHRAYGIAPKAFARLARMHLALWWLRRRDQPLAQLAQALGMADQSHLSREFRAMLGLTPLSAMRLLARDDHAGWALRVPQDLFEPRDQQLASATLSLPARFTAYSALSAAAGI
jgi:AraC-like DNA-binding protein